MGDYNLVLDVEKDKIGGRRQTHDKCAVVVKVFMEEENLIDIWRSKHPEDTEVTWRVMNPIEIAERLDFILISFNLAPLVSKEGIAPTLMSDHAIPLIVLKPSQISKGRGFWRLNVRLLAETEYTEQILDTLDNTLKSSEIERAWEWSKHKVREELIKYLSRKNKSRENKLLLYEKKLSEYNNMLTKRIANEKQKLNEKLRLSKKEILEQIRYIEREREELLEQKIRGSMRRAGRDWTQHGEKSSKYYLNLEGKNYKRKNRCTIIDSKGNTVVGTKEVLQEQFNFYQELYRKKQEFNQKDFDAFMKDIKAPKVKDKDREMLDAEISMDELQEAIFSSKLDKVSGSDGLPVEFYHHFFNKIKVDLLKVMNKVARVGLHTTAKQGIISLIEKPGKDLNYLTQWRPLSLLNVDGKIYMKILAKRLEKVTGYLLHEDQSGFQKKRSIHDNLMDLISLIDYTKKEQIPAIIVSFDFYKAFDTVNWDFLDATLVYFGFGENFRHMVKMAHVNTTSCTVNGGFSSDYMKIEQGLRQGSPLSPGLFNLVVEVLALVIRQENKIQGIQIDEYHKKVGQYADDLWAVILGEQKYLNKLMKKFEEYSHMSGLKINFDKTQVLRIGAWSDLDITLESEKNLTWTKCIKVLGIKIMTDRKKMIRENYGELLSRMSKTLDPWRARTMSLMGKIVVINNLMLSQTIYKILSLNTPNDEIIAKIKKLITDFLWDRKKPQIAYETLIKNYADGGLRLVDFRRKDQALKMSWITKSKIVSNIWVKIASKLLPIQLPEIFECNIAHKDLKYLDLDDNWIITSVLKAWSKTCFSTPRSKEEILDQPLWLNSHIRKGNQLLNNEKMRKRGIFFVRDIFDEKSGVALPFEDVDRSYSNVGNFIEYLACTQQIPPNWKKRLKTTTCSQGLPQGHAEIA